MVPSKKTGSAKSADLCAYTCVYSLSLIQLFATPWIIVARLLCLWNSPGKNIGAGCYFLLQGNLPNLGIKPASPALQMDSLPSEPPGKPSEESAISQVPVLLVTLSYLTLKGNT